MCPFPPNIHPRVPGCDAMLRSIIDIPVEYSPGKVVFWPKDNNDVWGPDSEVSDYWAVIAQEEQV